MSFDLAELIRARASDAPALCERYLDPGTLRILQAAGCNHEYVRAEGAYLEDRAGRRHLDFFAGFGVFALGRNHPVIVRALHDALDASLPTLVQLDAPLLAGLLAERLVARAPFLERVFFCNSGTEAVEAAMKFARGATGRTRVIHCRRAFHGLTLGSLSISGIPAFRRGYEPLLPGCDEVTFGDVGSLERALASGDVAAFVVEPIQGTGVFEAPRAYWQAVRSLCTKHGALLVADEVQTGLGRTGRFFAFENPGIEPDVVTLSKVLSGGMVPVGAVMARASVFDRIFPASDRVGGHGSTFSKNVLAMVAALATLHVLEEQRLVEASARTGSLLRARLDALSERYGEIRAVRGRGLMLAIDLDVESAPMRGRQTMVRLLSEHRVLVQPGGERWETLKLMPPFVSSREDVDWFCTALEASLQAG